MRHYLSADCQFVIFDIHHLINSRASWCTLMSLGGGCLHLECLGTTYDFVGLCCSGLEIEGYAIDSFACKDTFG